MVFRYSQKGAVDIRSDSTTRTVWGLDCSGTIILPVRPALYWLNCPVPFLLNQIRNLEFVFYPGSPLDKESGESGGPIRNVPDGTEESTSGSTDGSAGLTWGVTGGIIASAVLVGAAVGAVIVVVVVWRLVTARCLWHKPVVYNTLISGVQRKYFEKEEFHSDHIYL